MRQGKNICRNLRTARWLEINRLLRWYSPEPENFVFFAGTANMAAVGGTVWDGFPAKMVDRVDRRGQLIGQMALF